MRSKGCRLVAGSQGVAPVTANGSVMGRIRMVAGDRPVRRRVRMMADFHVRIAVTVPSGIPGVHRVLRHTPAATMLMVQ
jgi:hypothetical protein